MKHILIIIALLAFANYSYSQTKQGMTNQHLYRKAPKDSSQKVRMVRSDKEIATPMFRYVPISGKKTKKSKKSVGDDTKATPLMRKIESKQK